MNHRLLKILVALVLAPLASHAATVRVDGVVTEIENSSGLLPVDASIGDSFSILYYIQNVGGTDRNPDPQQGLYERVLYGMTMTIGGEVFDFRGLSICGSMEPGSCA